MAGDDDALRSSGPIRRRDKVRSLVHTALTVDDTVHDLNAAIAGVAVTAERLNHTLDQLASVLERFGTTVTRVDRMVDKVEGIADEMQHTVHDLAEIARTVGPLADLAAPLGKVAARVTGGTRRAARRGPR